MSERADQFEDREDGTEEAEDDRSDEGERATPADEDLHETST